ncbi:Kyphoscoliosis peptidase [Meloidogyne graminicola]|uniref:Kyphoscoliosis peptidase n=1 Tax=Meloidogyne graminicola TaxID=189291 RepID=A0A8S9ZPX3_9BILA|nr:Kyphoscoliosis peptidase [Meloidogyne graminicola]
MKEPCFRCKRPTYFNDKIGPLKDGTLFHKGCFKCWICGRFLINILINLTLNIYSRLSLNTYYNNRNDTQDLEVYCAGHVPTPGPHLPIPHRSNLLWSPKTKGEYPHNLMRT